MSTFFLGHTGTNVSFFDLLCFEPFCARSNWGEKKMYLKLSTARKAIISYATGSTAWAVTMQLSGIRETLSLVKLLPMGI